YKSDEHADPLMCHSIEMGWFVLDKYYTMTIGSPLYAAALLLGPSKRVSNIKNNWEEKWVKPAIEGA
ncbi:hypothetical protein DM02DRAFT_477129, partial [Periconia macrospinosa]